MHLGDLTPQTDRAQAVREESYFTFYGKEWTLSRRYNTVAWLRFAERINAAGRKGKDAQSLAEMAEFGAVLRKVVKEDQVEDFLDTVEEADLEPDQLFGFLNKLLETVAARPTNRPSDSSPGRPATSQNSTEPFSGEVEGALVPVNPGAF